MDRTLNEVVDGLSTAQREVVEHGSALIADELSLREIRKTLNLTQEDVARRLKKGQDMVSRIEQRRDLLLSTLNEYVHSIGGELELVCRFKDRPAVRITRTRASIASGKSKSKRTAA